MKRLSLALLFAASLPVQAVEYNLIQTDKSIVSFSYQQMGVTMNGKFRKLSAQLSFDPAKTAKAKAVIEVDLASVDAGSSEADQEVATKPWFNTKSFPVARFETSSIKPLGGNKFEATGKLTIKGKSQTIVAPATFTPQGKSGVFEGSFTIRRGDFAIGEGAWSAFDVVANDIPIKFRILANAK